jgi:hypothetical protein
LMKWDPDTGEPSIDCLRELGLEALLAGPSLLLP